MSWAELNAEVDAWIHGKQVPLRQGNTGARVLLVSDYDNKRARMPWDCSTETALESKDTNPSAPNQSPS